MPPFLSCNLQAPVPPSSVIDGGKEPSVRMRQENDFKVFHKIFSVIEFLKTRSEDVYPNWVMNLPPRFPDARIWVE